MKKLIFLLFIAVSFYSMANSEQVELTPEVVEAPCKADAEAMVLKIAEIEMGEEVAQNMEKSTSVHHDFDPSIKSFTINYTVSLDGEAYLTQYEIMFNQYDEGGSCYLKSIQVNSAG